MSVFSTDLENASVSGMMEDTYESSSEVEEDVIDSDTMEDVSKPAMKEDAVVQGSQCEVVEDDEVEYTPVSMSDSLPYDSSGNDDFVRDTPPSSTATTPGSDSLFGDLFPKVRERG